MVGPKSISQRLFVIIGDVVVYDITAEKKRRQLLLVMLFSSSYARSISIVSLLSCLSISNLILNICMLTFNLEEFLLLFESMVFY
jgi:hypothetical protein